MTVTAARSVRVALVSLGQQTTTMLTAEGLVVAHPVSLVVPTTAMPMATVLDVLPLACLAANTIMIETVAASGEAVPDSSEVRKPNWISNEVPLCLT